MADGAKHLDTIRKPFVPLATQKRLEDLSGAINTPITCAVVGGTVGIREGIAMAIARSVSRPLIRVDLSRCKKYLQQPFDLIRDLRLDNAIPYLINVPDTDDEPQLRMQMMALGTALNTIPYAVLVGANDRRAVAAMLGDDRPNVTVSVGRSTMSERQHAWTEALEERDWSTTAQRTLQNDLLHWRHHD